LTDTCQQKLKAILDGTTDEDRPCEITLPPNSHTLVVWGSSLKTSDWKHYVENNLMINSDKEINRMVG
jgi:hypothetical protein